MGGIWGLAASTALENLPVGLRGLASGVLQQGYAVGYLVGRSPFVALFWRSCGLAPSVLGGGIGFPGMSGRSLAPSSCRFFSLGMGGDSGDACIRAGHPDAAATCIPAFPGCFICTPFHCYPAKGAVVSHLMCRARAIFVSGALNRRLPLHPNPILLVFVGSS
jgi:hypothetical protein